MTAQEIILNKMDEFQNLGFFDYIKASNKILLITIVFIIIGSFIWGVLLCPEKCPSYDETFRYGIFTASLLLGSILITFCVAKGSAVVRQEQIKDIVLTAEELGLGDEIIVTENTITFKDKAISHSFEDNIFKIITKSNDGHWISVD